MDSIIVDKLTVLCFSDPIDRIVIHGLLLSLSDLNLRTVLFSLFFLKNETLWYERVIQIQLADIIPSLLNAT